MHMHYTTTTTKLSNNLALQVKSTNDIDVDITNCRKAIESALCFSEDIYNLPILPGLKADVDYRKWQIAWGWFSDAQIETAFNNAERALDRINSDIEEYEISPFNKSYSNDVDDFYTDPTLESLYEQKEQINKLHNALLSATIRI